MKAFVTDVSRGSVTFFRRRGRGLDLEGWKPMTCGRGGAMLFGLRGLCGSESAYGCEIHPRENSAKRRIAKMGEIGIWSEDSGWSERVGVEWAVGD